MRDAVLWCQESGWPQRVVLMALCVSIGYMLVGYTSLFVGLVLILALVAVTLWLGASAERIRRLTDVARRHEVLSLAFLLILVLGTPVIVPAIVSIVGYVVGAVVFALLAAAVLAGIAVAGWILVQIVQAAAEAQEAHDRWYNSLSEQEKIRYNLEEMNRRQQRAEMERAMRRRFRN